MASRLPLWRAAVLGAIVVIVGGTLLVLFVGGPLAITHRQNFLLERFYGDAAVGLAARLNAGHDPNPLANDRRALIAGRNAYTGSCAQCHGVGGDGKGAFGQATFPPATDLRAHDTQEKSDAQLFWIVKNGLSFTGMPGFGDQYSDRDIWSLVTYVRSLGQAQPRAALGIATPTAEQLAMADPSSDAAHRGAAVYFAQACASCHGAVGEAPGDLGLRRGERELVEAVRQGRRGMPAYERAQIGDAQMDDLAAYIATFPARSGRPPGEGEREGEARQRA